MSVKKTTHLTIGTVVGIIFVWFLFRNTQWKVVAEIIQNLDIRWLFLAQLFSWTSCFTRVQRWTYVVRALRPASFRSLFSATQLGYLVNFALPIRLGEGIRAYVLARKESIPFSTCLSTVALDRLSDLVSLMIVVILAVVFFPTHGVPVVPLGALADGTPLVVSKGLLQFVSVSLAAGLTTILMVLVAFYFKQSWFSKAVELTVGRTSRKLEGIMIGFLESFAAGMAVFRSANAMGKASGFSIITWGLYAGSYAATLYAFDVAFPWFTPLLMLAFVAVFISFPIVPAAVGQFHAGVIASLFLVLPAMNPDEVSAIAIVAHGLSVVPIVVLGVFCLFLERLNLANLLRGSVQRMEKEARRKK